MKVYRFVGYSVILLFFIFVSLPVAMAVSFTFTGTYDGQTRLFPVSSVGYNKPPYPLHTSNGSTLWSWDWQINSISNWALLDYPVPNSYVNNGPSTAQLLYGAPYNKGTDWGFEYTEDLGGNNTSTSKYWRQVINIGASTSFNTIADLLGVNGAFMYHEATAYDSATGDPLIERVNLSLTLIAFDLSDTGPDPAPGPAPVPEPSSMLLLGSGWIGLWGFRKKFRK
jgi:PEP-CTERM motif